jgi:hypothetical protein
VPHQPIVLEGDLFNPASKLTLKLNGRRIHELVYHLICSGQIDLVVELFSAEYIAAKFALGQGAELLREYTDTEASFSKSTAAEAASAAAALAKCKATVGRSLKHLEHQPLLFALQMCFQEPEQHPFCIAVKRLLRSRVQEGAISYRVLGWTNKPQQLDPCQLEIKKHTKKVCAVCYFEGADNAGDCIASASHDGSIKITSAVSGEVVLELQGHHGEFVASLAVCTDGTRMASGGIDSKVRVSDGHVCAHI